MKIRSWKTMVSGNSHSVSGGSERFKWTLCGLFVLLPVLLSACSGSFPRLSDEDKKIIDMTETEFLRNYIVVEPDGYPLGTDDQPVPTPAFKKQIQDAVEASLAATPSDCPATDEKCPLHLLLFVHGGLNSYGSDFERMVALMQREGPLSKEKTHYYPVFVNWNSSLDAVVDDLFWIRMGDRMRDLGPISFPFLLPARMTLAMANIPVRLAHTVMAYKEYCDFASEVKPCGTSVDDYVSWAMFPFYTITAPILDSFGSPAWYQMKRRAKLTMSSQLTTVTKDFWASEAKKQAFKDAEGAALSLVETLGETLKKQQRPVEVTLIGHSMGAFIVNRMLAAVAEMECAEAERLGITTGRSGPTTCAAPQPILPVKHVVYLAPASPLEEFDTITLPFIGNHPETQAWLFTLNRKDEAGEFSHAAQKIVPRGSLLTWIDGIFEPASSLGEKTLGRMANLEEYYPNSESEPQLACPSEEAILNKRDSGDAPTQGFRPVHLTIGRGDSSAAQQRIRVYQSLGYCKDHHEGPELHGDFSQQRYMGQVLCLVNPSTFKQSGYCEATKGQAMPKVRMLSPEY